ncbi:MAG: serpin family protein [Capsulimonas sp.]|uniref:serpin family protein n=1 Tax=Capsulimonas sp. TaxID=2494211 RepID=UPI003263E52C
MRTVTLKRGRALGIVGLGAALDLLAGCGGPGINTSPGNPPADSRVKEAEAKSVAADTRVQQVAAANTDFGLRLLKPLAKASPNGNVFYSPLSVTEALSMTMNGAGGDTQTAMAKTLGLKDVKIGDVNAANALLMPSLISADPKVEIAIANAIWVKKGVTLNGDFQKICADAYGGQATALDFATPDAAKTINGWVSDKTKGKIEEIIPKADVVDATAVLTNAVYFHGQWTDAFDKQATHDDNFIITKDKVKPLPFMRRKASLAYAETDKLQAVSLPYGGGRLSLLIVLPRDATGLDPWVKSLDQKTWDQLVASLQPQDTVITMPRFQASYSIDLTDSLASLGMGPALKPKADFTPMGLHGDYIEKVLHKAVLEVDEEGTVAAAATAVVMTKAAVRPDTSKSVYVNHPFVCAIRDNTTGMLLFAGVIRDPEKL